MALVPCKQCDAEISDKAKVCPKCGQEDPIARKLKCSECENMIVPSAEGTCPTCGNPDVLAEKSFAIEIISKNASSNSEVHQKQSEVEVFSINMKSCPFCGKKVQISATTCEHCCSDLDADYWVFLLGIPIVGIIVMWVWVFIWKWVWFKGAEVGFWSSYPMDRFGAHTLAGIMLLVCLYTGIHTVSFISDEANASFMGRKRYELFDNSFIKFSFRKGGFFGWLLFMIYAILFNMLGKVFDSLEIHPHPLVSLLFICSPYFYYLYQRVNFKLSNLTVVGVLVVLAFGYSVGHVSTQARTQLQTAIESEKR